MRRTGPYSAASLALEAAEDCLRVDSVVLSETPTASAGERSKS